MAEAPASRALARTNVDTPASAPVHKMPADGVPALVRLRTLDEVITLGRVLAQSGFFQDAREANQAVVKVLAGAELGFGPIASMNGVQIIKGKVCLGANLVAAAIKRSGREHGGAGRYDFRVTTITDDECSILFRERVEGKWVKIGVSTFTKADAVRAGTGNTRSFPRNMYFARALTNGARWFTPDVFGGPVYTPDELDAGYDEEGQATSTRGRRPVEEFPGASVYGGREPEPAPAPEPEPEAGEVEDADIVDEATGEVLEAPPERIENPDDRKRAFDELRVALGEFNVNNYGRRQIAAGKGVAALEDLTTEDIRATVNVLRTVPEAADGANAQGFQAAAREVIMGAERASDVSVAASKAIEALPRYVVDSHRETVRQAILAFQQEALDLLDEVMTAEQAQD